MQRNQCSTVARTMWRKLSGENNQQVPSVNITYDIGKEGYCFAVSKSSIGIPIYPLVVLLVYWMQSLLLACKSQSSYASFGQCPDWTDPAMRMLGQFPRFPVKEPWIEPGKCFCLRLWRTVFPEHHTELVGPLTWCTGSKFYIVDLHFWYCLWEPKINILRLYHPCSYFGANRCLWRGWGKKLVQVCTLFRGCGNVKERERFFGNPATSVDALSFWVHVTILYLQPALWHHDSRGHQQHYSKKNKYIYLKQ